MPISKNKLKNLTAYRMQPHCDDEAVFVVEGPKMAAEALRSGFDIKVVCATAGWLQAGGTEATQAAGVEEVYEVSEAELSRLSHMKSPNQVWLLVQRRQVAVDTAALPLTLALDCLQDPGNMGTIMRTADWFGVRRIICSADTVSQYNPKVVQASMGAVFRTRVEYVDLPQWLAQCGMPVYGATLGGKPMHQVARPQSQAVLLVGNESRGISPAAMAAVSHPVLIPNIGRTAESLNASVAAGILLGWITNQL